MATQSPTAPTVDSIIAAIIRREGGYVDHPRDPGGPTKYGITLATLRRWRDDPGLTAEDVRNLKRDEARRIYRREYMDRPGFARLPGCLQPLVVDMAVNHGVSAATRILQRHLIGRGYPLAADGVFGARTAAAATRLMGGAYASSPDPEWDQLAIDGLAEARRDFYLRLSVRRGTDFTRGWLRRCNEFLSPSARWSDDQIDIAIRKIEEKRHDEST